MSYGITFKFGTVVAADAVVVDLQAGELDGKRTPAGTTWEQEGALLRISMPSDRDWLSLTPSSKGGFHQIECGPDEDEAPLETAEQAARRRLREAAAQRGG